MERSFVSVGYYMKEDAHPHVNQYVKDDVTLDCTVDGIMFTLGGKPEVMARVVDALLADERIRAALTSLPIREWEKEEVAA